MFAFYLTVALKMSDYIAQLIGCQINNKKTIWSAIAFI